MPPAEAGVRDWSPTEAGIGMHRTSCHCIDCSPAEAGVQSCINCAPAEAGVQSYRLIVKSVCCSPAEVGFVSCPRKIIKSHTLVDGPLNRRWGTKTFSDTLRVNASQDGHAERGGVDGGGRRTATQKDLMIMGTGATNVKGSKQCGGRTHEARALAGWELLPVRRPGRLPQHALVGHNLGDARMLSEVLDPRGAPGIGRSRMFVEEVPPT